MFSVIVIFDKPVYKTDKSDAKKYGGSYPTIYEGEIIENIINRRETFTGRRYRHSSDTALGDIDMPATFPATNLPLQVTLKQNWVHFEISCTSIHF